MAILTFVESKHVITSDSLGLQAGQLMKNVLIDLTVSSIPIVQLTGPSSTSDTLRTDCPDVFAKRNLMALLILRRDSEACFIADGPIDTSLV
jgi:hypothetical protein